MVVQHISNSIFHYHHNKWSTFILTSIIYVRGARHGLTLSGKLQRIVGQEKQLLNENVINTENAQNIFQTWIEVKNKKRKAKKGNDKCSNVSNAIITDSEHLQSLINQNDYQWKSNSKKKTKQQRARDEDLAKSLSRLSTSNKCLVEPHNMDAVQFKFYGVQSTSKILKKEKYRRKTHSKHGDREAVNNDKKLSTIGKSVKQNTGTIIDDHYASSEDSEKDIHTDPMVSQIEKIMSQYPNKKFKVEAAELTPFQKKQLQKSGLRIEFKSKKRERKRNKSRTEVEKIIKKMKRSMDFCSLEK